MIEIRFAGIDYTQFDRRQVRSAMGKASRLVAKQLRSKVSRRGGAGATYIRNGQSYTASAPGQPPARLTGNLLASIKGRASRRGYALVVSAIAPHAHLLELGTARMARRPYFEPTFAGQVAAIEDLLRTAIDQGITVTAGAPGRAPNAVEVN